MTDHLNQLHPLIQIYFHVLLTILQLRWLRHVLIMQKLTRLVLAELDTRQHELQQTYHLDHLLQLPNADAMKCNNPHFWLKLQ
ncbi:MAG: hypothetical protein ACD_29C00056G0001 [uncultured bacterium]|nr:MAG: hypothetical protein ACD_29C00056G0001 [uncultured bacterium]